jgi:plasmid replication initiation protein
LFSIYLSKINPQDLNTRIVRFPLVDFQAIMDLSQVKITYFKDIARNLLSKMVDVPTERGGFAMFGLFRIFKIDMDDKGEWYVEIDAEDEALPLMFDYKSHYFKYELWNALRLKSKNQLRMYEVLKQYEKIGHRVVSLFELRAMLGISKNEYPRFGDFKTHVLEVCRNALAENTDISYDYEPHGKKGPGGKILQIKFTITKNKGFIDPLSLKKFINAERNGVIDGDVSNGYTEFED